MDAPQHHSHKSWLSKEVSIQWVLGLVLAGVWWMHEERVKWQVQMAAMEEKLQQRPDLIERRNREQDKLQECLQRQMDLLRETKRCH